jgi:peptide/nickel transport system substrate-binding protein
VPEGNYWTQFRQRTLRRRQLLGTAAIAGAGLAVLPAIGCGSKPQSQASSSSNAGAQSAGQPQPGGTFNWWLNSNYSVDPQKLSATGHQASGGVMSRVFRFKTGTDPNAFTEHAIENDLGLSAESPDAITWTVKLRPDAKFQNVAPVNGHPVEAEDVKATFTRMLDPATSAPNRGAIDMMNASQIQTPDKQTVVFKLNYPYAPLPNLLASATYSMIYPREVLTGAYDPAKKAIGSGPWILDTLTPDVAYIYKKNPDWFEKGQPYADTTKVAIITDQAQQYAQFAAGNLDFLSTSNPYDIATLKQQNPKAQNYKVERASPYPFYFQMGDPTSVFQDIRVRRAFSMAIDRDAIGRIVYNGEFVQPVFVPSYMGKWSLKVSELPADTQQYFKFNPSEAKKLLSAAGQTNLQLRIGYPDTFGTPVYVKHVETAANMLNQVGIKTTFWVMNYQKDFVDAGKGARQGYFDKDVAMFASAGGYSEADDWLFAYFHSKSTSNQEHLSDPTYDAMIDKERTIVNADERLKAVREASMYLADKMYLVPTGGTYEWEFINPRIQNFQYTNSLGVMAESFSKLWIKA